MKTLFNILDNRDDAPPVDVTKVAPWFSNTLLLIAALTIVGVSACLLGHLHG